MKRTEEKILILSLFPSQRPTYQMIFLHWIVRLRCENQTDKYFYTVDAQNKIHRISYNRKRDWKWKKNWISENKKIGVVHIDRPELKYWCVRKS